MVKLKYLFFLILSTLLVVGIFICHMARNKLFQSSWSQTCLNSPDMRTLKKPLFHSTMIHFDIPAILSHWIQNKTGFEIGGPSEQTWGSLGVYDAVNKVDVTNFASDTLWESGLQEGSLFIWRNQSKGKQYIRDAVDLRGVPSEFYDFVLASHVLEHIANPFKALLEWLRIVRSDGLLLIILPYKTATFDHKRDVSRLEHLISDYRRGISEADLSHLNDILRLHDLQRDSPAGDIESFKARSQKNFQNRALHQHVYDQELLYNIFTCLNLEVKIQITWGIHQLIIGQKR